MYHETERAELFQRRVYQSASEFIAELRAKPWMRKLNWLSFAIYSRDIEAMSQVNLGAANLYLGRLEEAESAFRAAASIDELYPLPYFNLAIVSEVRGERAQAAELLQHARKLGHSGATSDRLANLASEALARVEGTDRASFTKLTG